MVRKSIKRAVVALVLAASMGGAVTSAVHQPGPAMACVQHTIYTLMPASVYNSLQYKPHILWSEVINGVLYYYVQDSSCR